MAYSSTTERAAVSEHLIINAILPGLRGVKPNRPKGGWSFFCPLDRRKQNAPAAIWVNDDGWISVHCFDCRRNDELRELLVAPHLRQRSTLPPAAPRQSPAPPRIQPRTDYPVRIWTETTAIPADAGHPARRWLAQRNLWRPEVEAPAPLRWLPASRTQPGPHTGAGSLVALLAQPTAWAEGVADALALAARFAGPAIASMGDAGMTAEGFPQWLATATAGVVIHADNDDAGQAAASRLCGAVLVHGGAARAVLPPQGKDAGVVTGDHPFEPLTEHWPGYAATLAEMNGWPRWEAQRQAALLMEEVLA